MASDVNQSEFWQEKYETGADGWEKGAPAPPLAAYFRGPDAPAPGRALVPGCGRGHEALLLAELGWQVTGLDFAPAAIAAARQRAAARGLAGEFALGDFFEHRGQYDLVVEHTLYCAIDPARRDDYVATVSRLLVPGGRLVGLFWERGLPGGPPFDATPAELRRRFGARFTIESMERAAGSFDSRADQEWLMVARDGLEPSTQGL